MSYAGYLRIGVICGLLLIAGCSRTHYRVRADRETYGILQEKTIGRPWAPSPSFNIFPQPGSRFFDPTPIDDPMLPTPAPQLYAFELPEIPERDPQRFRPKETDGNAEGQTGQKPPKPEPLQSSRVRGSAPSRARTSVSDLPQETSEPPVMLVTHRAQAEFVQSLPVIQKSDEQEEQKPPKSSKPKKQDELKINPIPESIWDSIPEKCRRRMFEFESIREEYKRTREEYEETYGEELPDPVRDESQRLALEDIVKLALTNSREYQTQKEILYAVALALSFERFQFALKFDPLGNSQIVDYIHNRTGGIETNTLSTPTTFNGSTLLATGGTVLSAFANRVVLTFNGPEGFAADITSEWLFTASQSLFQRDIVLEPLTQTERDVVYAARDYARFRKTFFRNLAFQYYNLLTTYRNIEIESQNYFSNYRAFAQQEAEFLSGKLFGGSPRSRVQVDQIEQNALASRNRLIAVCNNLESLLDSLKLTIGIPPELAINLDLTELEEITLRDQTTIETELVSRAGRILQKERARVLRIIEQGAKGKFEREQATLLNYSIELARRLLSGRLSREQLGQKAAKDTKLEQVLAEMLLEDARLGVKFDRAVLATQNKARPELLYGRTITLIESVRTLIDRQLDLAELLDADDEKITKFRNQQVSLGERLKELGEQFDRVFDAREFKKVPELLKTANQRLAEAETLAKSTAKLLPTQKLTAEQRFEKALSTSEFLLKQAKTFVDANPFGLTAVEIGVDDAMLTAVTQRYDLMNLRGLQADAWRQIKLAADDLKSIVNLRATQIFRTDPIKDRPFAFNADNLETRLFLEVDAPLNRKAQRNIFRLALINYQAALRAKIELEDNIKLAVRDDLRDLDLDVEQYRIGVSSAALAFERVRSTLEQLNRGIPGVAARDFLEAQQDKTAALSAVTSQHIGYIQNRIDLFLDLELLTVDEDGFWEKLYDEKYQPKPRYQLPMVPPYGVLPRHVWHSHKIKRLLQVPPGETTNWNPDPSEPEEPKESDLGNGTEKKQQKKPETLPPPTPAEDTVLVPYFPRVPSQPETVGVSSNQFLHPEPVRMAVPRVP
ncbi:MAG: hypothetical protein ACFCD0_28715 [Gemmataceae bacterium]